MSGYRWANHATHLESSPTIAGSPESALLQMGYRFALSLTHHREEAEDLVQETWLNLCRRYGGVETRAVLFTSIRNLFIDQCRRRKLAFFESLDQPEVAEAASAIPEEPGLNGDLEKLLGKLKPAEREVIFLHYYLGNTAEEISQLTGQPRGSVLSLIHRSIAKLRKLAEEEGSRFPCNQTLLLFVMLMAAARTNQL
ncbi:MAG: RNA polymerase sigma factor [Verrucomicrobiota bacterium]